MVSEPKSCVSQESSHSSSRKRKNKLSYNPLPEELPLFEKLFKSCDVLNTNTKLISEEVHSLLLLSCLPDDVVKMIMSMTNNGSKHLDRKQFYIAIRLVQLRQNRVSVRNLTLTVPNDVQLNPPYFRGFKSTSSLANSQNQGDDHTNGDASTRLGNRSPCENCAKYKKEIEKLRERLRASEENVQKLKEENARLKGREKNIGSFLSAMDSNDLKQNRRNSISPHPFSESDEMEESLNNGTIRVDDFGLEDMHRLPNWTKRDAEIYTPNINRTNALPREVNNGGLSNTIHGYPRRIRDFEMLEDKEIDFEAHSMGSKEEFHDHPQRIDNYYDDHGSVIENIPKHLVFPRRRSSLVSDITSSLTIHHNPRAFEGIEDEIENGFDKKRGKKKRSIFGQRTKSIKSLLTDWT